MKIDLLHLVALTTLAFCLTVGWTVSSAFAQQLLPYNQENISQIGTVQQGLQGALPLQGIQQVPGQQVPQEQFQRPAQQRFQQGFPQASVQPQNPTAFNQASMGDIDTLVVQLTRYTKALHDQHHAHLEGQRHAEKLDKEVTAIERMAEDLHAFAAQVDGSPESVLRLRNDTNEFLQLSFRIARTIELTQPWLRGNQAQSGVQQMRQSARAVTEIALKIDQYLPVDTGVIDGQTERLEAAIKELHDEFHEHLENYEVSAHLDEDLEGIETLVEHMHELAHEKTWANMNLRQLQNDLVQVKQKTAHIESLFVRQAEIGVRTQDWVGIEHSRDAITDVLASAYLLEHMIRKSQPAVLQPWTYNGTRRIQPDPKVDRHGHPVRNRGVNDRR